RIAPADGGEETNFLPLALLNHAKELLSEPPPDSLPFIDAAFIPLPQLPSVESYGEAHVEGLLAQSSVKHAQFLTLWEVKLRSRVSCLTFVDTAPTSFTTTSSASAATAVAASPPSSSALPSAAAASPTPPSSTEIGSEFLHLFVPDGRTLEMQPDHGSLDEATGDNLAHNDRLFRGIIWLVLSQQKLELRRRLVTHFAEIAECCSSWQNYQTAGTIIAALHILRPIFPSLKLSPATEACWEQLTQLLPLLSGIGLGPPGALYQALMTSIGSLPKIPVLRHFIKRFAGVTAELTTSLATTTTPVSRINRETSLSKLFRSLRSSSRVGGDARAVHLPSGLSPSIALPLPQLLELDSLVQIHLSVQHFSLSNWMQETSASYDARSLRNFAFLNLGGACLSDFDIARLIKLPVQQDTNDDDDAFVASASQAAGFSEFLPDAPSPQQSEPDTAGPMGFLKMLSEGTLGKVPAGRKIGETLGLFRAPTLLSLIEPRESDNNSSYVQLRSLIQSQNKEGLTTFFGEHPTLLDSFFFVQEFGSVTALHYACAAGSFGVVDTLLKLGSSCLLHSMPSGNLPLHFFVSHRQLPADVSSRVMRSLLKELLKSQDLISPLLSQNQNGDNALHMACRRKALWAIRRLTKARAPISAVNKARQTPLDLLLGSYSVPEDYFSCFLKYIPPKNDPNRETVIMFLRSKAFEHGCHRMQHWLDSLELRAMAP
ncbi:MAG: hypothetical protein K2Q09_05170, partial [Phycisphaerales bacterium]|nr:hypothetical protein [Phycisphaerales bacterium]